MFTVMIRNLGFFNLKSRLKLLNILLLASAFNIHAPNSPIIDSGNIGEENVTPTDTLHVQRTVRFELPANTLPKEEARADGEASEDETEDWTVEEIVDRKIIDRKVEEASNTHDTTYPSKAAKDTADSTDAAQADSTSAQTNQKSRWYEYVCSICPEGWFESSEQPKTQSFMEWFFASNQDKAKEDKAKEDAKKRFINDEEHKRQINALIQADARALDAPIQPELPAIGALESYVRDLIEKLVSVAKEEKNLQQRREIHSTIIDISADLDEAWTEYYWKINVPGDLSDTYTAQVNNKYIRALSESNEKATKYLQKFTCKQIAREENEALVAGASKATLGAGVVAGLVMGVKYGLDLMKKQ